MKLKHLILATLMSSTATLAEVSGGGNGGDYLILQDDSIVLAEKYITDSFQGLSGKEYALPLELVNEFKNIGSIISGYSYSTSSVAKNNPGLQFIMKKVLDKRIKYIAVDSISNCRQARYANLPEGSELKRTMCTEGFKTYIDVSNLAKMNLRQMAVLFVHEGLLRDGLGYEDIGRITAGLDVLLNHYNRQINGEKTTLTSEEITLVENMMSSLSYNDFITSTENTDLKIHPYGGGLVSQSAKVEDDSFIGITSIIGAKSILGHESEVYFTNCLTGQCILDDNTKISNVDFNDDEIILKLKSGSFVQNLDLKANHDLLEVKGAQTEIRLKTPEISLDENTSLIDAKIYYFENATISKNATIKNFSSTNAFKIFIAQDSKINNVIHSADYLLLKNLNPRMELRREFIFSPFSIYIRPSSHVTDVSINNGGLVSGENIFIKNVKLQGSLRIGDNASLSNFNSYVDDLILSKGINVSNITNFSSWFPQVLISTDLNGETISKPHCKDNEEVQFLAKESVLGKIHRATLSSLILGTYGLASLPLIFIDGDSLDLALLKIEGPKKMRTSCIAK
ncbi:MAG: hypothetical protein AB7I27_15855 [Bacteriovoracaceae bacterium]